MILRILFKKTAKLYLKINKYIQSKKKRPFLIYLISEIVYAINLWIGRKLVVQEFYNLDFDTIKRYYNFYGEEATLKKFKINKQILDKVLL